MMFIETTLRALLALAGLLLPGTGWALARRWPLPWFAGGVISALAIMLGVIGLSGAGVPVTMLGLGFILLATGLPGWWFWWRKRGAQADGSRKRRDRWLLLPVLPMLAVAVWRATTQPLWAADAGFRWNLLAELIVRTGGLAFYPPVSPADFGQYFWADGIAPLASGLYAWTYLAMGNTAPIWTALPVLLQTAALLALLNALGREWGGDRGGRFACALGAATMLLQFAFNLAQETGLTALGAGGMVLYLLRWRTTNDNRLLIPPALCAALAACAREYGAVAAIVGAAWILLSARRLGAAVIFAAGALLPAAIWHLRVWVITGNPLYAQGFGGLLPTNPVFDAWMQGYVSIYGGSLTSVTGWTEMLRIVALTALSALGGFAVGALVWRRGAGWSLVLAIAAAFVAAWIASVPFTAGGLFYSMRVLSPALLLGCAWGGACLAQWVPGRRHLAGVMAGLSLYAVDASLRALTMPVNPYGVPPTEWLTVGDAIRRDFLREDAAFVERVAQEATGLVLSDAAGLESYFRKHGREYRPLWSPDVGWLFSGAPGPDAAAHLRRLGYSHLLLKRSSITADFLRDMGVLSALQGHLRTVSQGEIFILLEIVPGK